MTKGGCPGDALQVKESCLTMSFILSDLTHAWLDGKHLLLTRGWGKSLCDASEEEPVSAGFEQAAARCQETDSLRTVENVARHVLYRVGSLCCLAITAQASSLVNHDAATTQDRCVIQVIRIA